MPAFLPRVFLLHKLFNSILVCLVPKKLRFLLPVSWYSCHSASTNANSDRSGSVDSNTCTSGVDQGTESPRLLPSSLLVLERMDQAEVKRVFQMFDHNGDGRITRKELSDSLESLGMFIPREDLAQMIQKIDANGDGCVDLDEFGVLYQSIMDEKDEEEQINMREAFNVFDQNGDGHITVEELKSVLAALGLKQGRTSEDCKRMITKVDADGDGMVDFKEFMQMMKGGGFCALG